VKKEEWGEKKEGWGGEKSRRFCARKGKQNHPPSTRNPHHDYPVLGVTHSQPQKTSNSIPKLLRKKDLSGFGIDQKLCSSTFMNDKKKNHKPHRGVHQKYQSNHP